MSVFGCSIRDTMFLVSVLVVPVLCFHAFICPNGKRASNVPDKARVQQEEERRLPLLGFTCAGQAVVCDLISGNF